LIVLALESNTPEPPSRFATKPRENTESKECHPQSPIHWRMNKPTGSHYKSAVALYLIGFVATFYEALLSPEVLYRNNRCADFHEPSTALVRKWQYRLAKLTLAHFAVSNR